MSNSGENGSENGAASQEEQAPAKRRERRVTFAPVPVPPPEPPLPPRKKRWSLIRSLAKGKRLTSLTKDEDKVLKTLSSSVLSAGASSARSADSADSEASAKAREDLRKSIHNHKRHLTHAETEFLQDLIDSPDVEPDQLANVEKVLANDPLYQSTAKKEKPAVEENKAFHQKRRKTLLQQAPSYRKELWLNLRHESQEITAETFAFTSPVADTPPLLETEEVTTEKEEEEEHFKPEQKRKSSKWNFVYQFQKALNLLGDNKDEETAATEEDDSDEDATFCVLAHSITDLIDNPTVLTPPIMDGLRAFLPFEVQHDNFWLKYSFARGDGASFYTLLDRVRNSARTIIAIETDQGDVFGSFTSSPWRIQSGYYGSAQAFLWRLKKSRFTPCDSVEDQIKLESDLEVFEWSRHNRNIQTWTGMDGELIVGGGGYEDEPDKPTKEFGAGLTISSDQTRGSSEKCLTFNSPTLPTRSVDGVFNIANLEVWTLTPVLSLEDAERLELSRQFIFDHGGFCGK